MDKLKTMSKTQHIAIIHRHGARYVCQEAYDLLSDTKVGEAWVKENIGQLTETGFSQSRALGRILGGHFLGDLADDRILWVSSSKARVVSGRVKSFRVVNVVVCVERKWQALFDGS